MCKEARFGLAAGVIFLLIIGITSKNPAPEKSDSSLNPDLEMAVSGIHATDKEKPLFRITSQEKTKPSGPTLE